MDREDGKREFVFVEGPIFAHILLGDEINRSTPKTQAALLEAMAEQQVTVAGTTYRLQPPFFVLATLNPIEMEGTYPLPEAQLDRFFFKVRLTYPTHQEIQRIIGSTTTNVVADLRPVFDRGEAAEKILALRQLVRDVLVAPHIEEYIAALIHATIPTAAKYLNTGDTARTTLAKDDFVNRYVSFGSTAARRPDSYARRESVGAPRRSCQRQLRRCRSDRRPYAQSPVSAQLRRRSGKHRSARYCGTDHPVCTQTPPLNSRIHAWPRFPL